MIFFDKEILKKKILFDFFRGGVGLEGGGVG